VKWHDGQPFTAKDVVCTFDLLTGKAENGLRRNPRKSWYGNVDRVTANGDLEVTVHLKRPQPSLLSLLASGYSPIYPCHVSAAQMRTKPVGTGPFKFVEWIKDERLVLEANKDYHRGAPAIDRLVFRPVPELTTRVAALLSGQADLVSDIPPDQTAKIQSSGVARVEISTLGGFVIMVKLTNYLMPGPWQDARVRKAINLAIDMDTIIKTVLEGHGQVLGVPLEKEAFGFNPNIKWYGYDSERARALLREAGYANGFEMTLHAPNRRYMNDIEVMQAMAQMLSKVGIKAKVEVWEQSVYTTKWRKRELLPAYMTAWGGAGVFDGDLLTSSLHSKSALAIFKDDALDKMLEEAQATSDPERRKAIYWKAQELIYEQAPIIKAYQQAHIFGVSNRLDWKPWVDNMLFLYDAKLK